MATNTYIKKKIKISNKEPNFIPLRARKRRNKLKIKLAKGKK